MNLTGRARSGLNDVALQLRRQPIVEKTRGQWVEDVVAWCRQQDIDLGRRLSSQALRFDAELLAQIDDVLESARLAPLGRSLSGLPSSAQAKEGVEEDKATREGPRAWRAGGLTPRGGAGIVGEGGEGGGCGGGGVAVAVGGFTHGRSGSAGSDDAGGGWSSDSGTCPHCPSPPSCRVWFLRIPAALDRPALSARIDVT